MNKHNHKKSTCDTKEIPIDYLIQKKKTVMVFEIMSYDFKVYKNYPNGKSEFYFILQWSITSFPSSLRNYSVSAGL